MDEIIKNKIFIFAYLFISFLATLLIYLIYNVPYHIIDSVNGFPNLIYLSESSSIVTLTFFVTRLLCSFVKTILFYGINIEKKFYEKLVIVFADLNMYWVVYQMLNQIDYNKILYEMDYLYRSFFTFIEECIDIRIIYLLAVPCFFAFIYVCIFCWFLIIVPTIKLGFYLITFCFLFLYCGYRFNVFFQVLISIIIEYTIPDISIKLVIELSYKYTVWVFKIIWYVLTFWIPR